ncbi:hypothetical protein [Streptomyces tremellae]
MCVTVRFESGTRIEPWDPTERTITVPAGLSPLLTVTAVRAVLAELCISQPPFEALCFCGETIETLPRVPEQRSTQVVSNAP